MDAALYIHTVAAVPVPAPSDRVRLANPDGAMAASQSDIWLAQPAIMML